jgi:BlaI family transcriptional regulator, penicillinase repressor
MARPTSQDPTPAELEILEVLWKHNTPKTVRDVKIALDADRKRAYTTVMTLMNTMVAKGLLATEKEKRPFAYSAAIPPKKAKAHFLRDLWLRVFGGSTSDLVGGLLEEVEPNNEELARIKRTIEDYMAKQEVKDADLRIP